MSDIADVSPHQFVPLIAPVVERLTLTLVQEAMTRAAGTPVAGAAPPDAMRMLGQLRIALLARPVTAADSSESIRRSTICSPASPSPACW